MQSIDITNPVMSEDLTPNPATIILLNDSRPSYTPPSDCSVVINRIMRKTGNVIISVLFWLCFCACLPFIGIYQRQVRLRSGTA